MSDFISLNASALRNIDGTAFKFVNIYYPYVL